METLYVWLFGFAGATIMVLGMFLLSSERELKNNDVSSTNSRGIRTSSKRSPPCQASLTKANER